MSSKLRLIANRNANRIAYEEVIVRSTDVPGQVVLVQSPGLILGVAAGDVLRVDSDGDFNLVRRGGNLCIQIFFAEPLHGLEAAATDAFLRLGGRLDGKATHELVYTVGVSSGFSAIEQTLLELTTSYPGMTWYYGNVYDPVDGITPLNWWLN